MAKITQTKLHRLFQVIKVSTKKAIRVRRETPLSAQILKIPCNRCGEIMYKGVGQVLTYHKGHKLRVRKS